MQVLSAMSALIAGILFIYVLPEGECMNRVWYEWLILNQFPKWITKALGGIRRRPSWIIQDHEKALWTPGPLAMMKPGAGNSPSNLFVFFSWV